jgi:hypothetical protein
MHEYHGGMGFFIGGKYDRSGQPVSAADKFDLLNNKNAVNRIFFIWACELFH